MEIADIKQQLTLSRVLQHYGLKPDKHQRLCCPFHEDRTPSLQVYYKTHTAYCFSSACKTHGKSMDVIDFVMHMDSVTKHEAIEKCKELASGMATKPAGLDQLTRAAILTKMFIYFKNALHNSRPALEYIKQRGLDNNKIEVGYNSGQFHHGTRKEEALIKSCMEVGLLSEYDRAGRTGEPSYRPFAKLCLVFALRNRAGQVSGMYFRSTVNDRESRHFYLRDSEGLYPGYPDAGTQRLIVAEAVIDAATLLQVKGVRENYSILAAYGTNRLSAEHVQAIKDLPYLEEIIFAFDNDEPGNMAASKYAGQLKELLPYVMISKINLPENEDINSVAVAHDENIFMHLLESRTPLFLSAEATTELPTPAADQPVSDEPTAEKQSVAQVQLDSSNPYKIKYAGDTANYYVQGGLPKATDHMKVMLVVESKATSLKARNRVDLYEDKQVERLSKEVAEKLALRKDLLEADLYRLTDLLDQQREKEQQQPERDKPLQVLTVKERQELEAFAREPKLIKRLNELLGQTGIVGEERNRIFLLVIAISHKMPETLHALIQGSSGSGKTRLLKQISDCVPPESVTKLTRLSDKVLYNFPENYFVNRLLCLEDIDGLSEEAEFAFRELQSNGELNSATSIKLESGQITSGQKTVRGPIASLACTTRGEVYEDNMSRVFLIAVDESAEQTKRIIEYQNSKAAGLIDARREQEIKKFMQSFISILHPYEVINPFAGRVQLPSEAHKIRRLNDLFQSFVKMITIINQYQRKRDESKRLVTELEDVETAVAVMFESIVLKVDELDGSLRQFYEQLKSYLQKQYNGSHERAEFSLREVRQALKASKTQVFRYAGDLTSLEYIRQCGGYQNKGFSYKICYWDNYQGIREKIRQSLEGQLKALKSGTPRNASGTLEPA